MIDKGAVVSGFVYCNGETELKGTINGAIYTQSFYLKTASSAYQNHLLNAEILNQLPEEFIPIPLLEVSNQIKIVIHSRLQIKSSNFRFLTNFAYVKKMLGMCGFKTYFKTC